MKTIPLKKLYSGKVRDLYEIDDQRMLMVASDRLSAFDVILNEPIPGKGELLTAISLFWFDKLKNMIPNHLCGDAVADVLPADIAQAIEKRAIVVKRLTPLKCEAVVRGYLAGGGWKEYQKHQAICGIALPAGLQEAEKLPTPIFTPSTKADLGAHDENISFDECAKILGADIAQRVRDVAIALYQEAAAFAKTKGIIIADTKFEFGLDETGQILLMDEVLTPDSSRFWPEKDYQVGTNPPSFDKQFVRDWLEHSGWNKQPPAPTVPEDVIRKTRDKYAEVLQLLTAH